MWGSLSISFFRMAENKKHFIHFEHFYPSKMNEMLFVFSHSENVKYNGNSGPIFFLNESK
jgi:hypothetical protein